MRDFDHKQAKADKTTDDNDDDICLFPFDLCFAVANCYRFLDNVVLNPLCG